MNTLPKLPLSTRFSTAIGVALSIALLVHGLCVVSSHDIEKLLADPVQTASVDHAHGQNDIA